MAEIVRARSYTDWMASEYNPGNSAKPRVVMGLLLASLILMVVLAYQAHLAATSHLRTAQNALREYASLIADEFTRRSLVDVGFHGYFQLANLLRSNSGAADNWIGFRNSSDQKTLRALALVEQFFEYDFTDDAYIIENGASDNFITPHTATVRQGIQTSEQPFTLIRSSPESNLAIAFVSVNTGERWVMRGFSVNLKAMTPSFERAFSDGDLLPQTLANGAINNEVLYLSVNTPNGETLFKSGTRYDPYLVIEKSIGDDYQGILQDLVVTASIDPAIASSLVIGGLPRSRLPMLLGLMIVTTGLMGAAVWIIRGEQSLMKMRNNFIAQVSHELKTPLTQIRMFSETLLMDRIRNDQERRQSLQIINRESQRLAHLVDNVMQFSRENNGLDLSPTTHHLAPSVQKIINEIVSLEPNMKVHTELDPAVRVKIDIDALRQILLNLVDNAQKYGPATLFVSIEVYANNDTAYLTISDNGPGIPADARERIWTDFYRLERDHKNSSAGTGIGLSIVRALVRAHGGDTYVDADYIKGTKIVIELPVENEATL